jgi:phage major head subunit gpT-like protein
MGIFNASSIIAAQRSFKVLYMGSFEKAEPLWPTIAMEAPSDGAQENYEWLGTVPRIKEWLGNKVVEALRAFDFFIKNRDWEGTIGVDRNDFDDDRLGRHAPRIKEIGEEANLHPDELVSSARVANALCYDGQNFYDTDHSEGESGAQSNIITGTGVTAALVRADYFTAKARFRGFKDDQGRPRIRRQGNLDLVAVIPPALEAVFDELNNPASGSTVPKTVIPYKFDPYLADSNDYYYDYVGAPLKPFILQMRKKPTLVELTDEQASVLTFMSRQWLFSSEARYNVGLGLWQLSAKVTNT